MSDARDSHQPPTTQFPGFASGASPGDRLTEAQARGRAAELGLDAIAAADLGEIVAADSVAQALSARLPRVAEYAAEPAHVFRLRPVMTDD